jgi:hypothetical protein
LQKYLVVITVGWSSEEFTLQKYLVVITVGWSSEEFTLQKYLVVITVGWSSEEFTLQKYLVVTTVGWSSEEFTLQTFGLALVAKFCLGVYPGEAKGSVLDLCVTFVCCWSFHVLLTLSLPN